VLLRSLEDVVEHDPAFFTLMFEIFTLARRNEEIAAEMAELTRRTRAQLAELLGSKQHDGVLELAAEPDAVAAVLFALGDGLALWALSEPGRDLRPTLRAGVACARTLLGAKT
jgi:hypothetical protein